MKTTYPTLLRKLLLIDALTCGAMALLLVFGKSYLANLLALPEVLLWYTGLLLIPVTGLMLATALSTTPFAPAVWAVIIGNDLWVVASVVLMTSGWINPNALGYAFIGVQALVVTILVLWEFKAWRGSRLQAIPA